MNNSKLTIVVVDDSPSVLELFKLGTKELAVDLVGFVLVTEAEEFLKDNKPALLFLDNIMPEKNGLSLLKDLRELPLHKDTKTIIISTKDYEQDRKIAEELGAIDFIVKPIPIQTIKDIIAGNIK